MSDACEQGYKNLTIQFLRQLAWDYEKATEANNISELVDIEKAIMSDDFFGEICGVTSENMLRHIRQYGYDTNKYLIVRDKTSGLPVSVTVI